MLDERDYMHDTYYDVQEDGEPLASPLLIKIGANPVPDSRTPTGRHQINFDAVILALFIVAAIAGHFIFPVH